MRVLVIEDDEELAHTIATGLRDASIAVDIALDGQAGLTRALLHDYEVIVLDRDLPILHGDHVCTQLIAAGGRSRGLMLTGAADNQDLIDGLGLGADDYLTKPFAASGTKPPTPSPAPSKSPSADYEPNSATPHHPHHRQSRLPHMNITTRLRTT
jgi:CheY-like chemotaxis protein